MSASLSDQLFQVLRGHYPQYIPMALAVIAVRLAKRQWRREESFLLTALIIHSGFLITYFLLAERGNWPGRYFISAVPIYLAWTALGWRWLYFKLRQTVPWGKAALANGLMGLTALALAWDGQVEARHAFDAETQAETKAIMDCADWLRDTGRSLVPADYPPLRSTLTSYHNSRLPIIMTDSPAVALYAACDVVTIGYVKRKLTLEEAVEMLGNSRANFLVLNRDLLERVALFREYDRLPADLFRVCFITDPGYGDKKIILGYMPHLKDLTTNATRQRSATGDTD
jgi:hypothetical protein